MKILAGKRENPPDLEQRAVLAFLSQITTGTIPGNRRVYPGRCSNCNEPVKNYLTEDVETGEIWAEGPDFCPKCEIRLADENPQFQMLSQEAIKRLFGPAQFSDCQKVKS
ncbi:MAG: hypothetical protein Q8L36_00725 [bacterium]|nr:hypothetical protein [bacterium]